MSAVLDKRQYGVFYTGTDVASILAKWAIRSPEDKVLEPSFGGCTFLSSSFSRLESLGCDAPSQRLWGFDVDPAAFVHLERTLAARRPANFIQADFLTADTTVLGVAGFDVVFGNPPYISYELMSTEERRKYRAEAAKRGLEIPGKPSSWVYFVLFSLQSLKIGGRMAWILPWSLISTYAGEFVQRKLRNSFARVGVFAVEEELFGDQGTNQRTVVLLAEGYQRRSREGQPIQIRQCRNLAELALKMSESCWAPAKENPEPLDSLKEALDAVTNNPRWVRWSDRMDIRIGIVTGHADCFLLAVKDSQQLGLQASQVRRCLKRPSLLQSLIIENEDFSRLDRMGEQTRLIILKKGALKNRKLAAHLRKHVDDEAKEANRTFQKREPWYAISPGEVPDGIFRFFAQNAPFMAVNSARVLATNSSYSVFVRDRAQPIGDLIARAALVSVSSIGQAHAELSCSRYGPGALKLRVADVASMPLPEAANRGSRHCSSALRLVDAKLRTNDFSSAKELADAWLTSIGCDSQQLERLSMALQACRGVRQG